jgi:hypothetical protein
MLAWQVVPLIALLLTRHVPLGRAPDGLPAVLEVASAAVCVLGAGLTLSYPSIVIMRHVQRGAERFSGLPPWALVVTFTGGMLLGMHGMLHAFGLAHTSSIPFTLGAPGVALMSAGVLFAELLRRSRPARVRTWAPQVATIRMRREHQFVDSQLPYERVA